MKSGTKIKLLADERTRKIIRRKQRLPFLFTLLIIILFFGFVGMIGFAPDILSIKLTQDGVLNLYLVLSAALIILVCILMNIFVSLKLKDDHEDIHELIREYGEEHQ